jgi:hypothetical protein
MASSNPEQRGKPARSSYVSEWFGHRVYPVVTGSQEAFNGQRGKRCPFLSVATLQNKSCVKPGASSGICTLSSTSNGPRQDWLVCPYRALDPGLLEHAVRRLFSLEVSAPFLVAAAPTLALDEVRGEVERMASDGGAAFIYLQDKLGGEIGLPATERSPEMAFDVTVVEIVGRGGHAGMGRFGILEVQTMDFHGSYRHAVKNLEDALRLHGSDFHRVLESNQDWLSDHIEGPNISNVFKRTFYQMILKFQIGAQEACAGCVLAIPRSVWDSWQRHLGRPDLHQNTDGTYSLRTHESGTSASKTPAWIMVFDTDVTVQVSPGPLLITKSIATDADSIAHYALRVAPEVAVAQGGSADGLMETIRRRLSAWWPGLTKL